MTPILLLLDYWHANRIFFWSIFTRGSPQEYLQVPESARLIGTIPMPPSPQTCFIEWYTPSSASAEPTGFHIDGETQMYSTVAARVNLITG